MATEFQPTRTEKLNFTNLHKRLDCSKTASAKTEASSGKN